MDNENQYELIDEINPITGFSTGRKIRSLCSFLDKSIKLDSDNKQQYEWKILNNDTSLENRRRRLYTKS